MSSNISTNAQDDVTVRAQEKIRPLEGMRALAIVAVVLFHLQLSWFAGGYVGVDIFFVISGFIISRNISLQTAGGEFSVLEFYVKRIRRLLPALLATILGTLIASWFILPPALYAEVGQSGLFSSISLANIFFWLKADYFDLELTLKPMLHTWSLSVEEQFYLIWPFFLILLMKGRHASTSLLALFLASFAATWFASIYFPTSAFYLLPFRVYQFAAGALLALGKFELRGGYGDIGVLVGVLGLGGISALMDGAANVAIAGGIATLLGMLLIACRSGILADLLLGNSLVVFLGSRSYALYLVHWPIIVLYGYSHSFDFSSGEILLLLIGVLAMAELLYWTVERTFRQGGDGSRSLSNAVSLPAIALLGLAAVVFSTNIWVSSGYAGRLPAEISSIVQAVVEQKKRRFQLVRSGSCFLGSGQPFERFRPKECIVGSGTGRDALVLGNSLGADTYLVFSRAYPSWTFSQVTAAGCPVETRSRPDYPACEDLNEYRLKAVFETSQFDLIIIASASKAPVEYLRTALLELRKHTPAPILLVGPRVRFAPGLPLMLEEFGQLDGLDDYASQRAIFFEDADEALRTLATEMDLQYLDIRSLQCPNSLCKTIVDDNLVYLDIWHISPEGADYLAGRLTQEHPDLAMERR